MREVLRRVCVCLFVVSFVFSGVTWAACIDLPASDSPAASAHSHHHADAAVHNHAGDHHPAVADQAPSADHGDAHALKCCGMAPVFSLAPNLAATPVTFSGEVIAFRVAQRDLTGFVTALDPGIPKSIV